MLATVKNLISPANTVANVMSGFRKTIDSLEAVKAANVAAVAKQEQAILEAQRAVDASKVEIEAAEAAIAGIASLFGKLSKA